MDDRGSDLTRITATPRAFRVEGLDYPVPKLRPRDVGEIQAWLAGRFPDPRVAARAAIKDCPFEGLAIRIWEKAEEEAKDWPPRLGGDRCEAELATADGLAFMAWILLRRSIPGFDREKARDLADRMEADDFQHLMGLAAPERAENPKA